MKKRSGKRLMEILNLSEMVNLLFVLAVAAAIADLWQDFLV